MIGPHQIAGSRRLDVRDMVKRFACADQESDADVTHCSDERERSRGQAPVGGPELTQAVNALRKMA